MNDVLLLGAGLVARPLADYLLTRGYSLTVADSVPHKAEALVAGHDAGHACGLDVMDRGALSQLVGDHRLTVSLLPATMHDDVARICLDLKRSMATASYVSDEMRALDAEARELGVILLNELGVDPGIDHMSAMQIIHQVQGAGGDISSFRSYCGGLPAPDSNDNPWGYKFSWSPRAVLRASTNGARYLRNGELVEIEPGMLFLDTHPVYVEGIGKLEAYPNRDSMGYQELYGLQQAHTMFRGTLRYPGWGRTLRAMGLLGLLDDSRCDMTGISIWARLVSWLAGFRNTASLRENVAAFLWLPPDDEILERFSWLGILDNVELPKGGSVMGRLSRLMEEKLSYLPDQRDMIVMRHEFVAHYDDRAERITSTMVDLGVPGGDSSMARTVSLPLAITARMFLDGELTDTGVVIPLEPHVYKPILAELAELGIALREETSPL